MGNKFKDIEKEFEQLRKKFRLQEISREEFIKGVEKLKLQDEKGQFWMIGAKSGRWYYFDGRGWVQSEPPSILEKRAICIHCGFDNDLEAQVCVRCGGSLEKSEGSSRQEDHKLHEPSSESSDFVNNEKRKGRGSKKQFFEKGRANFLFRSLNPYSFLLFSAMMGLLAGIVLGAIFGATSFFAKMTKIFPVFFQEIQGNLLGGIIYAILGGFLGLVLFSLCGFCIAFLINFISSLVGGIRVYMERIDKID